MASEVPRVPIAAVAPIIVTDDTLTSKWRVIYEKGVLGLVLIGLVGAGSAAAWRWWKLAQTSALPTGIVSGNGRIESVQVDVAAKYGGRIREILAREGDLVEEGQVLVKMDTRRA